MSKAAVIEPTAEDFVFERQNRDAEWIATPSQSYWKTTWQRFVRNKLAMTGLIMMIVITLLCIIGPMISGWNYEEVDMSVKNQAPSAAHWFGTDQLGRDLFTRVWRGGRISIFIGIVGALVSVVVGCIYGGISAYFGGVVDTIMMRIVEILTAVPHLLVVMLLCVVLNSDSIGTLMFAMLVTSWCNLARLVRSQMLRIGSSEYVAAARQLGVHPLKIVITHLIPNCMSLIVVNLTFQVPGLIFNEAFLSYVGLGVQSPETSWGALASAASGMIMFYPYQLLFPTLMIALTMLGFVFIGDGLRDAMDPELWR